MPFWISSGFEKSEKISKMGSEEEEWDELAGEDNGVIRRFKIGHTHGQRSHIA